MKKNEFLELSSSPLMNLNHTYRYSGTKLEEAEPLSQHIVDTIMMGLKIIDKINTISGAVLLDSSKYVMKAVYHDLEEVITGDIPRPLKYYNESTRDSLKEVADQVAKKFFKEQFCTASTHYKLWEDAKCGDEGYILKIVDTLVVATKVVKEVSILHNFYMLRVAHEVSQYLRELYESISEHSPFNVHVNVYLMDIIKGAMDTMDKIISENKESMESLNIYGHSMI